MTEIDRLPVWVIPEGVDREQLLSEVQLLIWLYKNHTYTSMYICQNCEHLGLQAALLVVRASLRNPALALEANMGVIVVRCTVGIAMRIEWLRTLKRKLKCDSA